MVDVPGGQIIVDLGDGPPVTIAIEIQLNCFEVSGGAGARLEVLAGESFNQRVVGEREFGQEFEPGEGQ